MGTIKIGEKEYTEEQLQNALSSAEKLQKLNEQIAPVQKLAERYNLSVEDLAANSEGAFNQLLNLQEAGLIDEHGKMVKKETPPVTPKKEEGDPLKPDPTKHSVEAIAAKVLEQIQGTGPLEKLTKQVEALSNSQAQLLRERTLSRVQDKHPNLTEQDVSIAIAKANARNEDFWKVAEEISNEKEEGKQKTINEFAQEHNLDLEQMNKIKEMKSDEGAVAEAVLEGKKVSFKKGENTVTPKEATMAFFRTQDMLEGGNS